MEITPIRRMNAAGDGATRRQFRIFSSRLLGVLDCYVVRPRFLPLEQIQHSFYKFVHASRPCIPDPR